MASSPNQTAYLDGMRCALMALSRTVPAGTSPEASEAWLAGFDAHVPSPSPGTQALDRASYEFASAIWREAAKLAIEMTDELLKVPEDERPPADLLLHALAERYDHLADHFEEKGAKHDEA